VFFFFPPHILGNRQFYPGMLLEEKLPNLAMALVPLEARWVILGFYGLSCSKKWLMFQHLWGVVCACVGVGVGFFFFFFFFFWAVVQAWLPGSSLSLPLCIFFSLTEVDFQGGPPPLYPEESLLFAESSDSHEEGEYEVLLLRG